MGEIRLIPTGALGYAFHPRLNESTPRDIVDANSAGVLEYLGQLRP